MHDFEHIELAECDSTQNYLKEILTQEKENKTYLISTQNQRKGIGRSGHNWSFFPQSLACSFNIRAHPQLSLTTLELGVLTACFLESKGKSIKLKWPNDLLNQQKEKVGGIICHLQKDWVIAGIGLNLIAPPHLDKENFPYPINFIFKEQEMAPKASELFCFIQENRITCTEKLIKKWNQYCIHLESQVRIDDTTGIFKGICQDGEALLELPSGAIKKIMAGSLFILD